MIEITTEIEIEIHEICQAFREDFIRYIDRIAAFDAKYGAGSFSTLCPQPEWPEDNPTHEQRSHRIADIAEMAVERGSFDAFQNCHRFDGARAMRDLDREA